jgi:uncharacterized membrane protein
MKKINSDQPRFDDVRMETIMGHLLRAGVLISSFVVLIGGVLYLYTQHGKLADYRHFLSEPEDLRELPQLLRLLFTGNPAAIIQCGVLLLIATPVARVVFACIAFFLEEDRLYLGISLLVLTILLTSITLLH